MHIWHVMITWDKKYIIHPLNISATNFAKYELIKSFEFKYWLAVLVLYTIQLFVLHTGFSFITSEFHEIKKDDTEINIYDLGPIGPPLPPTLRALRQQGPSVERSEKLRRSSVARS